MVTCATGAGVGPLAYRQDLRLLCVPVGNQLSLVFVHTYVLAHRGLAMCLAAPYLHICWPAQVWAADAMGRRVLALTSSNTMSCCFQLILKKKIATAEETRPHRALGRMGGSGRGEWLSPCSALSLSLHLPPAHEEPPGLSWGPHKHPPPTELTPRGQMDDYVCYLPIPSSPIKGSTGGCQLQGEGIGTHNPYGHPQLQAVIGGISLLHPISKAL